ncbi:hypothetical protein [Paenibacillus sp. NAIST15-1]|nr:hypothetical protein [Paenibacillus sp. NAIST15-1]
MATVHSGSSSFYFYGPYSGHPSVFLKPHDEITELQVLIQMF